jgi:hypothetical protein
LAYDLGKRDLSFSHEPLGAGARHQTKYKILYFLVHYNQKNSARQAC